MRCEEKGENEVSEGRQRKISTWFCALGYYNNVFTSENSSSSESRDRKDLRFRARAREY